jgi:hypothetical protein
MVLENVQNGLNSGGYHYHYEETLVQGHVSSSIGNKLCYESCLIHRLNKYYWHSILVAALVYSVVTF